MTRRRWNEETLSELPAVALLERLGCTSIFAESLKPPSRLATAIRHIDPWISSSNGTKAISMLARINRRTDIMDKTYYA